MAKFRLVAMAALAASVAFAPTAVTRAQECPVGLEAADCTLFTDAFAGLNGLTSLTSDYTFTFSTTGLSSDSSINATGTLVADITSLSSNDPSQFLFSFTADGSVDAGGQNQTGAIELRIVDGTAYINTGDQWFKAPVEELINQANSATGMGGTGSGSGSSALPEGVDPVAILGAFSALASNIDQAELFTWTGEDVEGGRQITLTVNTAEILNALEDPDVITALQSALGPSGASLTEAQVKQITTLLRPTLEASTFQFSWTIDPESKAFTGFGVNVEINVDQSLAGMAGSTGAVKLALNLDVDIRDLNETVTIEPVADAQDLPNMGTGSMTDATEEAEATAEATAQ